MQQSENYKPNQSRGILLLGFPGSGKTTTAIEIGLGEVYIADCDNNLSGAHRYLTEKGIKFHYDLIDVDEEGQEVEAHQRFNRLATCIKKASSDERINTIILDSFTKVTDYLLDDILRQQQHKTLQMQDWGVYLNIMKRIITQLRSTRKLFIGTAHIRPEKDEVTGIVKYFPALPGQIQNIIGALFSDVWLCEVIERSNKHEWQLKTMSDVRHALKNSFGFNGATTVEEVKKLMTAI